MKIRYGTRGSPLALAQADEVAKRLGAIHPSLEMERVVIHTSGDRFAQIPSAPVALAEGGGVIVPPPQIPAETGEGDKKLVNVKAMFVKEIEEALSGGFIDFAVHSAKDLPGGLLNGLEIAAYPSREDARDVFIGGPKAPHWENLSLGAMIGTSSLRRQIQLRLACPGVSFVPLRGNVDTRLKRLEEGKIAAIVLAMAGLKRLQRDQIPHQLLPVEVMVPAPGQGAIALEARSDRKNILSLLEPLDDAKTRIEVECERRVLKAMGGGCQMPLGAHAQAEMPAGKNMMTSVHLSIFWSDVEGKHPIRRSGTCAASEERMTAFIQDTVKHIQKASNGDRG